MVERDDFASGTSSRSTKLIHGGVRYLQKAIMQLDREQVICMLSAKIYFHWIMQEDNLSILFYSFFLHQFLDYWYTQCKLFLLFCVDSIAL